MSAPSEPRNRVGRHSVGICGTFERLPASSASVFVVPEAFACLERLIASLASVWSFLRMDSFVGPESLKRLPQTRHSSFNSFVCLKRMCFFRWYRPLKPMLQTLQTKGRSSECVLMWFL